MHISNASVNLTRRGVLRVAGAAVVASAGMTSAIASPSSETTDVSGWSSKQVGDAFRRFALEHRMPVDLQRWLSDPSIQLVEPYRIFDNVWNIGVKWVSAYAVWTKEGWVLIDTTHEPFVDHLFENLKVVLADGWN